MNLLLIFVGIIIFIQFILFVKTMLKISKLKKTLSGEFSEKVIIDRTSIILYENEKKDPIGENINKSINDYLFMNQGSVSDFNLLKDIVERNCDTLEAEISSQTPLPLYLGLMGTVAGIILGLFTIPMYGGFSHIDKVIVILMNDVAIAMIASFMGIGFTTFSLWKSKQCKVTIEINKNRFYTWIQTHLLPVVSKSAVSAITLLQKNLTRFNETFTGTVEKLEDKLGNVGDMYASQIEILEKIEAINIQKMASANVKILSALDGSLGSLEKFSKYMENVTEYLTAVRDLNSKLDDHLERTETLGVVSEFYKSQMKEIGLRQDAIKSAVLSVDDVMKSALSSLKQNSESGLKSMQEAFVSQMMTMQKMISNQTDQISAQMKQMPQFMHTMDEIAKIPTKLDKILDKIEKSNNNLVKQISQSTRSVPSSRDAQLPVNNQGDDLLSSNDKTKFLKWLPLGILVALTLVCIANLSVNIMTYNASSESHEMQYDETPLSTDSTDYTETSKVYEWSDNSKNDSRTIENQSKNQRNQENRESYQRDRDNSHENRNDAQ